MLAGQQPQQPVLQRIGVLMLVDLQVAPAPPVAGQHVAVAFEQRDGEPDQVVEVQRVRAFELGRHLAPDRGHDLLDVVVQDEAAELVRGGRAEVLARDEAVLGTRDRGQHLVAIDPCLVSAREVALEHALGVALVVDRVARRAPGVTRVRAQDARAQGVEGAERDGAREPGADAAGEPLAHLAGRLVGEGDRQDLTGVGDALLDQVRGAFGHYARLAGAGAGDHEQRAVGVQYGVALLGVERVEPRSRWRRVWTREQVERRSRWRGRSRSWPSAHGARPPGCVVAGHA